MPEEFSTDFVLQDLARSLTYTFQEVQGIIGLTNASVYHLELKVLTLPQNNSRLQCPLQL